MRTKRAIGSQHKRIKGGVSGVAKWKPHYVRQAYHACASGMDSIQLAKLFDVTPDMVVKWQRKYPKFKKAIKHGRYVFDSGKVERSLLKLCLGYEYTEVQTESIRLKVPKQDVKLPAVRERITKKHVSPSVTAIIFWLSNRQGDLWQHVQKQIVGGKIQAEIEQELTAAVEHKYNLKGLKKDELETLQSVIRKMSSGAGSSEPDGDRGGFGIHKPSALHPTGLAFGRN